MRPFASLLCLVVASLVWAADPSPEPDDDNDAKKILGTWELVKAEMDGNSPPGDEAKGMKIEITKDQFIITRRGRDRKEATGYKLDTKSKPHGIDISPPAGVDKMLEGIYKFDKGELTICWDDAGGERPTKFDGKAKVLMVLRKAKAKK